MNYISEYPPVNIPDILYSDLSLIHESVVKLTFNSNGRMGVGTGFFIHIPDSPYEVILTAGHNLYTHTETFTTSVSVLLPNPDPRCAVPLTICIPSEHVKVCPGYLADPTNEDFDYGAILIPHVCYGGITRPGFGFNMMHAFSELRGQVNISSYRSGSSPGRPLLFTGTVLNAESSERQLVCEAIDEPGSDGSPMWIADDAGEIAAVAIQIQGRRAGSQVGVGLRISPELLCEVYKWVGLDNMQKISAQNISKQNPMAPPSTGLYMLFSSKSFARLQRGTGSSFCVFPANVTSTSTRYVLAFGPKWVKFDIEGQKVILLDRPTPQSLFTKKPMRSSMMHPDIFYISLQGNHLLRMDGSKFKSFDLPDAQKSGLSMVPDHDKRPFIHFKFEPCTLDRTL